VYKSLRQPNIVLGRVGRAFKVIVETLSFSSADDPLAVQGPSLRGNDRALSLALTAVVIEDHPVASSSHRVSARRVREQRGVMSFSSSRVKNREPRFVFEIETSRRDRSEQSRAALLPILTIDVKDFADGGLIKLWSNSKVSYSP
jgi:hypothetical protein